MHNKSSLLKESLLLCTLEIGENLSVDIQHFGTHGEGVGVVDGYSIYVQGALPGETVLCRLIERRKNFGKAQLISVQKASLDRVEPQCKLFGKCGGCQLSIVAYEKQLEIKQARVNDAFDRKGIDYPVAPCSPSPMSFAYRNKIQLPVQKNREGTISIGLYAIGSHELIPVEKCEVHSELGETVYSKVRALIQQSSIDAFDPVTGKGFLKYVLIKTATKSAQVLVTLITTEVLSEPLFNLAKAIASCHPSIKGVVHNRQPQANNTILGSHYEVLFGQSYIQEELLGLYFNISAASFFQVNPLQAERLYAAALEYADLRGDETVLDSYCGVGTLSLVFSRVAQHVLGVECVPEAIKDAKENARVNQIANVTFVTAHAEKYINCLTNQTFDVILINPPRKGCERSFLQAIHKIAPKKIIYISCDPDSLARDLKIFLSFGYVIEVVQPFDMFPQTYHVETVVKLVRS